MQNFSIRIQLDSPVIVTDGYGLDALLAHQLYEQGGTADDLDGILARQGSVHAASWFFIEGGHHGSQLFPFVRSQRAGEALDPRLVRTGVRVKPGVLKVDNKRGVAGNILSEMQAVATPALWAFGNGHPDRIHDLLAPLAAIGRKRSAGFGVVRRIEVGTAPGWDGIGISDPDAQPMRAVPRGEWRGNSAPLGAYTLSFPRYVQRPQPCVYPPAVVVDATTLGVWSGGCFT